MGRLGRPRAVWTVVCPNGTPQANEYGLRSARAVAKRRRSYCPYCELVDQPHRVVEYRAVEKEEEPRG